ncbi:MAG: hypothetical protein ACOCQ3_04255 [Natronomonas sp.]
MPFQSNCMATNSTSDVSADTVDDIGSASNSSTIEELLGDLNNIAGESSDLDTTEEIRDIEQYLVEAHDRGLVSSRFRSLDARDAAEAFVGSVIFTTPLLVEDGVFDIAEHLVTYTLSGIPVFLLANTVFVVFMSYSLIEWTGRNRDETRVIFRVIPVRLLMTLGVSFLVATVLMTVWGRIEGWGSPMESIVRISVIWTVGSLGAALGDIISEGDPRADVTLEELPSRPDGIRLSSFGDAATVEGSHPDAIAELNDGALIDELMDRFHELEAAIDESTDRRDLTRLKEQTNQAALDGTFGDTIQKYTSRDVAEGFVGSIFFSIPLLVEDGVFDVAAYFLSIRIGPLPVFFLTNTVFVVVMILGLVFWAGPQNVRVTRPILGFIPRRLVGAALVSFLTAAALMTMWGRVDNWNDPVVALARISVVWTVASFGASLGDILPGESSGEDINDELATLGELT